MRSSSWLKIVTGAALIGGVAAILSGRSPRWLRIMLVLGIVVAALGAGVYVYRCASRRGAVSRAFGSVGADVNKVLAAMASRMASANSPVRLKVLDKGTARE